MKILLDECLPRRLRNHLPGHEVRTVPQMGWAGIKNGKLLSLLEPEFDVFVTIDGNLPFQQHLSDRSAAFLILVAPDNALETLTPVAPRILAALATIRPGDVIYIEA